MKYRFPLHVHIGTIFLILIVFVGGIIGGMGYKISRDILESTATKLTERIGLETAQEITSLIRPAEMATRLLALDSITQATSLETRMRSLGFMREMLNNAAEVTSFFVGYDNGDFFLFHRLIQAWERSALNAPPNTAFVVRSIEHRPDKLLSFSIYFDSELRELRRDESPEYGSSYDPRARVWYKAALSSSGQIKTSPYLFFTLGTLGVSIAEKSRKGNAVVGADFLLETLSYSLQNRRVTPGTKIVLVDQSGKTLAFDSPSQAVRWPTDPQGKPTAAELGDLGAPVLAELAPAVTSMEGATPRDLILSVGGETWRAVIRPMQLEGAAEPIFLITAIPDSELMRSAHLLMRQSLMVIALIILVSIPITWLLARLIARPMRKLAGEVEAIRNFDFSGQVEVASPVLEVDHLAQTIDGMQRTIRRFMKVSMAVAEENDFDRLLPRLLSETISAANADAGFLFLADEGSLVPASGLDANGSNLPNCKARIAFEETGPLLAGALEKTAASAALLDTTDIKALGLEGALEACRATHAVAVPLLNRQQNLVGALLLLRRGETDNAHLKFIEALSGSAAVSLETKEMIRAQKLLFEGFIQLLAGAIDAKSPYTGGHCARVPELTKMLARAACNESSGPFAEFELNDEEWEAVHVAAWLHDCGKVTTPEYVVDKATKLETLYDRIHEVRMRFEVLKRDAEISCLKAIAAGEPAQPAQANLAETLQQLDADYAFVAECNQGGEFMAPEKQSRLREVAARTWMRTLDDRIGISHEELKRRARSSATQLPAVEKLLDDKPEHLFERRPQDIMPADNKWGFRMPVPELLYNKGELHNLSIARGTLSDEERYKINEHIVQTFIMLSQLPFPKHLRNVPEIATGHHEKMDGTGYPRKLRRNEMSPLARMMAIADIFEALMAVDRPYKKGKTLSEAIKIMSFMKKDQHIDSDLFDLFLRAGVYQEYATRFVKPEQIDKVDISAYLNS